jgi:2',3'-cyclic-nucleotide 2'-phosphodiesterase/3'-nucleotidase
MRHVSGMNPYSNNVWAVRTTGAQLLDWLERSALIFNTLSRDDPDQMLVDPAVPGFRFDSIYGLTCMIDPRRPPLFDTAGKRVPGREGRILDARWNGHALRPEQEFLVATTDHRAGGGGVYKTFNNDDIVVQGHAPMQDVLLDYLKAPVSDDVRGARPWRFAPDLKRRAILLTAPEAIHYLEDIAHLRPEVCGETPGGFLRVRLHL